MMDAKDIAARIETVQEQITLKFGIRHRPLEKMLKRVGRRVPRRIHAKAAVLLRAEQLARNPKLSRQIDLQAVTAAHDDVIAHLKAIDVAERRKARALSLAGSLAFNVLAVAVLFVLFLWWRGYV